MKGSFRRLPQAFNNGVLTIELARLIKDCGKHWVSERECARHIHWRGEWKRVDKVDRELRAAHPESFRPVSVQCRNGETKQFWAFTQSVRLKKHWRKQLVIVHERAEFK